MSEKKTKISVEHLYLIFGDDTDEALEAAKQGESKQEVLKETGCTIAVNDATFEVYDGEIFVIMGLSGSGKSTLIRCLNRLIEPTTGTVIVEGENIMEIGEEALKKIRRNKIAWHHDLPIGVVDEFDHFLGWVYRKEVIDLLSPDRKRQKGT